MRLLPTSLLSGPGSNLARDSSNVRVFNSDVEEYYWRKQTSKKENLLLALLKIYK